MKKKHLGKITEGHTQNNFNWPTKLQLVRLQFQIMVYNFESMYIIQLIVFLRQTAIP